MNKHLLRTAAVLVFGALAVVIGNGQVSALATANTSVSNSVNTLKISPVRSDVTIKPGETKTVTMKVTNISSKQITFRPIENDFISGDERGTPALILDGTKFAPKHSLKRFMAPLQNVTIPAGAMQDVTLTINVPANAQAGGYYGAVRFEPVSGDGSSSVNLNTSAASLVLLTVPGDLVEQLNLTNFDLQQNGATTTTFLRTPDNISVAVRFENDGNVQVAPFGQLYAKQGDKVVYTKDFNQGNPRDTVLPDSARRWDIPVEKLGTFGRYTIGATFTYGTKNKSIDVSKTIWIIPTAYIIGAIIALVVLLLVIVGLFFLVRRKARRGSRSRGRHHRR